MDKEQVFKFNTYAIPDDATGTEVANALIAYLGALDVSITEAKYNKLSDWAKKYWKLIKE